MTFNYFIICIIEYLVISYRCIICEEKMNDLFSKGQCEYCKSKFFLTKEKKYFYCKART